MRKTVVAGAAVIAALMLDAADITVADRAAVRASAAEANGDDDRDAEGDIGLLGLLGLLGVAALAGVKRRDRNATRTTVSDSE
jgi:hypothetical protein